MQNTPNIILGIDPGTVVMGYGIIEIKGTTLHLIEMNVLKLSPTFNQYQKLECIHKTVLQLIHQYKPCSFAIEAPFFGKNVQSMLTLGRAQGVAIAAAIQCGLVVSEYSPKKIKQSITGNGSAGKEQVMKMLQHLLSFSEAPAFMDASDGVAVAVCHHFQKNTISTSVNGRSKGWKDFLVANPQRIK
ncbi:MAG: crossover junction endodeoxyribonuclease RuvC [Ferruginibacter sp.]